MTGVADAEELRRLLAEAERYRQLVETPHLIPWELELATWRFTYVGPQALTILGYPLDAWYQPGFWPEHIHPADRDAAVSFCISSTEAGKDHEFEYRMIAADGRAVWLRDLVSVVKERAGRPVGLRGVMLDVTAEKEADRCSRLSEQRFRDFAEVSSDWFWETGEDHAYTWVSDTTEAKLGMVPEWFIGRRRVDIANTALDPDAWAEHKRRLTAHEPYSNLVMRVRSPRGDRWVRSSGRPIFDESGEFRGYRGTGSDVTAQVEAERETQRALALFRSAIESIPDGFSLYDADDRFVTCNSVTLKMMGETAAFAKPGMPFESIVRSAIQADFIPAAADDPEGYVRRRMEQHRNPAGPIEVENRMRWLRIHESRMPDGGTVIIHTDITDRVAAERETGRALALFRNAIDSIPDGFALFDQDDRFVTCNEPYRKLMGRSGITVEPGTPFETIVRAAVARGRTPEADADPEAFIRRRLELHRDPKGPFEIQGKGGWVRIQESRMPDGGTVNILTDITSQVEAQRETQRALALFESAIASIPDGFALFDADDRFVTCNEPYRKPVGEPAIDIEPGTTFESLIRGAVDQGLIPDAVEDPEGWVNRRMELHRNPKGPFELERKNRWLRIQESRMADGGTVIVLTDITREKQREEQLRQTQKMDALGKLTGGLAHDFNNLLAVIAGNIELLAEELPDRPDLLAKARAAIRASERGATLTRSLLAFARQQPLQPDEVDLNRLVSDLYELIRRTIPENIAIGVATHQGLWHCTADAGQLQNALLNLVVNARDAMPNGGTLTIQTAAIRIGEDATTQHGGVRSGDYAMLAVTDTGTGMAPEVVQRAFEPFFTMKPVGKGTGLGLSMVYGFARQSGGHATISSTVGAGTTVRIWLPRWGMAATPPEGAGSYKVRHATGGEKVLVVEDDPDLLALIASQLGSLGYGVAQAGSGPDALDEIARHEDIALLLTDVVLAGGMMGPDLARHALAKRPGLAVLLMSGYAEDTVLRDGLQVSGARLLAKPFTLAQLSAAIRDALDGDAVERITG